MKKRMVLLAVIVTLGLVLLLSGKGITGMIIGIGGPAINIEKIEVFSDNARIRWTTNEPAKSTLSYEDKVIVFNEAKEFEAALPNLDKNKKYYYTIKACAKRCASHSGYFITREDYTAPMTAPTITGSTIMEAFQSEKAQGIKNALGSLIMAIAVMGTLVLAGNAAYHKFGKMNLKINLLPNTTRFNGLITKAEKSIETGMHEEAYENYEQARQTYQELSPEQKIKNYNRLIAVYDELMQHYNKKEVDGLVEKYTRGNITDEEMQKLREMIERR